MGGVGQNAIEIGEKRTKGKGGRTRQKTVEKGNCLEKENKEKKKTEGGKVGVTEKWTEVAWGRRKRDGKEERKREKTTEQE